MYQTQEICAVVPSEYQVKLNVMIFDSDSYSDTNNTKIVHCGVCGSCSHLNGIRMYKTTTQTLYQNARLCIAVPSENQLNLNVGIYKTTIRLCTYRFLVGVRRGIQR